MPKTRILLTGADGLIGSHILDQLLGHDNISVRTIVGTQRAASSLLRHYTSISEPSLEIQVAAEQDFNIPGIFDELLTAGSGPFQAVVYNCNATPFDEADCLAKYINLETETIVNFLRSVKDVGRGVNRVVIATTLTPFARWLAVPQSERFLSGPSINEQNDPESTLATCQASDNVVHDAVLKWAKENNLQFDIVWMTAPSIYGPTILPLEDSSEISEANRRIWDICYRGSTDVPRTSPYGLGHFLDVRDFASSIIRALFTDKAANKHFMVSSGLMPPSSEIAYKLVARFPRLEGIVRIEKSPPHSNEIEDSSLMFLDSYLVQNILGISQLHSAEQTLVDTAQQFVDLLHR